MFGLDLPPPLCYRAPTPLWTLSMTDTDIAPAEDRPEDIARIEQMRAKSAALSASNASLLPPDPLLTPEAQFIRSYGITPMEFLLEVMQGIRAATAVQLSAARSLLPYTHRPQMTKVQTESVEGKIDPVLARTLELGTTEQLTKILAEAKAQLATVH